MTALKYIDRIPFLQRETFTQKVDAIARALGINANWLMIVMYAESKLNPKAVNPYSGATGLIQFLPSTAKSLGTSTAALKGMNAVQQLDYVQLYFRPYSGRMNDIYDAYFAVFYPKAIGKPDSFVLFVRGSIAYTQNAPLDTDKDGYITVLDVKQWFEQFIPDGTVKTNSIFSLTNILFASLGFFIIIKKKRNNSNYEKIK